MFGRHKHGAEELRTDLAEDTRNALADAMKSVEGRGTFLRRSEHLQLPTEASIEHLRNSAANQATPSTTSIDAQPTATRFPVSGGTPLAPPDGLPDSEISLVEGEPHTPEPVASAVGTDVWGRFEKMCGDDVDINEFIAERLDRDTRPTE